MEPRRLEAALAAALSRALLDALRESSRARLNQSQEILGKPQQLLNLTLILETYLQLITSWLGALAIVWATVVILGPFSTVLTRTDFWFTITILFIEATKIVGWGPKATFFLHLPGAIIQRGKLMRSRNPINIAGYFTVAASLITLAPILQAASCLTLPAIGLVSLARYDYYKVAFMNDPRIARVKPALIFFYALVLTQGELLFYLFLVAVDRSYFAEKLRSHYFGADKAEGKVFVNRYVADTLATCVQNGVISTANRTLVIFATELLQSIDINDHVSAVSVLRTLIDSVEPGGARLVKEIYSSKELVGRLVELVSTRSLLHQDAKLCVAEIFVKLGRNVRLADIPGAAMSISCLIDASLIKTAELVLGFQILDELAVNPENRIEMCNMKDVVSRIIAPINNGLHMVIEHDPDAAKILKGSLRVVAKLTSGTGESCTKLRRKISGNRTVISNILSILRECTDQDMNIYAAEILTRSNNLKKEIMDLFEENIQHLVTVINSDGSSNEYRAVVAQLLAQICDKSENGINPVTNSLSMVLRTIINIQNANPNDLPKKRCLASLLGLAVRICRKLPVNNNDGDIIFIQAVTAIQVQNLVFVNTLVQIVVQMTNDDEDRVVCLAAVKATTNLAIWMMQRNAEVYLPLFQQVNILEKLEAAVQAMHHLDRYVILKRRDTGDENQGFETLRSVVRNATSIVWLPPPPPPPPAAPAPAPEEPESAAH